MSNKYRIRRDTQYGVTSWVVYPPEGHDVMRRYYGCPRAYGYGYGFTSHEIAVFALFGELEGNLS